MLLKNLFYITKLLLLYNHYFRNFILRGAGSTTAFIVSSFGTQEKFQELHSYIVLLFFFIN